MLTSDYKLILRNNIFLRLSIHIHEHQHNWIQENAIELNYSTLIWIMHGMIIHVFRRTRNQNFAVYEQYLIHFYLITGRKFVNGYIIHDISSTANPMRFPGQKYCFGFPRQVWTLYIFDMSRGHKLHLVIQPITLIKFQITHKIEWNAKTRNVSVGARMARYL